MKSSVTEQQKIKDKKAIQSQLNVNCTYMAADTINMLHGNGRILDLTTLVKELINSSNKIDKSDLKEVEKMLLMQAKTLDYVFYDALKKLVDLNMINQIEVFTDIAFKAQAQSRKTLAVLAELRHPRRTTFIRQQNNAINQQINGEKPNFEKSKKVANELLSEVSHEALNFGGAPEAISINKTVEAMEPVNRS